MIDPQGLARKIADAQKNDVVPSVDALIMGYLAEASTLINPQS